LEEFPDFLARYQKIPISRACKKEIESRQLDVWVNRKGTWTQIRDVGKLWGARREKESLCRGLVTGLLGMSNAQYESMKDAFEDDSASERIGIYQNLAERKYAIVVRMPEDNKSLLAGVGAAIGAAGLGLGLATRNGVTIRGKSKWLEAHDPFLKDAHLLSALYSLLIPKYQPIVNQNPQEFEQLKQADSQPQLAVDDRSLQATKLSEPDPRIKVYYHAAQILGLLSGLEVTVYGYKNLVEGKQKGESELVAQQRVNSNRALVLNMINYRKAIMKSIQEIQGFLNERYKSYEFKQVVDDLSTKVLEVGGKIEKYDKHVQDETAAPGPTSEAGKK
jgi:hypothetical protein